MGLRWMEREGYTNTNTHTSDYTQWRRQGGGGGGGLQTESEVKRAVWQERLERESKRRAAITVEGEEGKKRKEE